MPDDRHTEVFQIFCRQLRQNLSVDLVFTKYGFVLTKPETSQPTPDIHGRACPNDPKRIIGLAAQVVQATAPSRIPPLIRLPLDVRLSDSSPPIPLKKSPSGRGGACSRLLRIGVEEARGASGGHDRRRKGDQLGQLP